MHVLTNLPHVLLGIAQQHERIAGFIPYADPKVFTLNRGWSESWLSIDAWFIEQKPSYYCWIPTVDNDRRHYVFEHDTEAVLFAFDIDDLINKNH